MERRVLTFSQAEGLAPLPTPIKLGELSREFRARLFAVIYESLEDDIGVRVGIRIGDRWSDVLRDIWVRTLHQPIDNFTDDWKKNVNVIKHCIINSQYNVVFDFTQAILRSPYQDLDLIRRVKPLFEECLLAYTMIEDGPTIIPRPSDEELIAIRRGLTDATASAMSGAKKHLLNAMEALANNDFAACVRESIHSVESCAQVLSGKPHATMGDALGALKNKGIEIHPAFERGISNLYGYTSNEKGIRHALLDAAAKVDMTDAMFMLGACASFVSYLINKGRKIGLVAS